MIRAYFAREEHLLPQDEANRRMIVAGIHEHLTTILENETVAAEWLLCNAVRGVLSLEDYDTRALSDVERDGIFWAIDRVERAAIAKIKHLLPARHLKASIAGLRQLVAHHAARSPTRGAEAFDLVDRMKIFANELHIVSLRKLMERRAEKTALRRLRETPQGPEAVGKNGAAENVATDVFSFLG